MAQKRPSTASIRKSQRNIVEGMGTVSHMKYAEAAKRLGVTQPQLKRYLDRTPKTRRNFSRSPAYRKIYEASHERKSAAQSFGVKRINRYEHKAIRIEEARKLSLIAGKEKHPNSTQVSHLLIKYYYSNGVEETAWATWTRENDLPVSINAILQMFKDGKIDSAQYHDAYTTWRGTYKGIKDSWAARYQEYDDYVDYTHYNFDDGDSEE